MNIYDVYSHLADSDHKLEICYTEDGLHLNGRGYLIWKKSVEQYVNNTCTNLCENISIEEIFTEC